MADTEIKVKKAPEKEVATTGLWPGFETSLFGRNFFELSPFALMRRFNEEMDRFFNGKAVAEPGGLWAPAVEVKEEGGKLCIMAELPGLKKEDVKVQVTEEAVILEGERKHEKEEKREGFYHSERSYGHFYRAIPLPKGADTEKTTAEYKNGVLEVKIPVPESKPKAREIPVKQAA